MADVTRYLVQDMQENFISVLSVCVGVASVVDPRLCSSIYPQFCDLAEEEESQKAYTLVTSVSVGICICLGRDLITQVSWLLLSDAMLTNAIINHSKGLGTGNVSECRIRSAMLVTAPRDKRTLVELVKGGYGSTKPVQLLIGRIKTPLQRAVRISPRLLERGYPRALYR